MNHAVTHTTTVESPIEFGRQLLTLEQVVAVAKGAKVKLCDDANYQEYIQKGARFIDSLLHEEAAALIPFSWLWPWRSLKRNAGARRDGLPFKLPRDWQIRRDI